MFPLPVEPRFVAVLIRHGPLLVADFGSIDFSRRPVLTNHLPMADGSETPGKDPDFWNQDSRPAALRGYFSIAKAHAEMCLRG